MNYLRNGFGAAAATVSVSAKSVRPKIGLGVSLPISRHELHGWRGSAPWAIKNITERLVVVNSEWNAYTKSARSLKESQRCSGTKKSLT